MSQTTLEVKKTKAQLVQEKRLFELDRENYELGLEYSNQEHDAIKKLIGKIDTELKLRLELDKSKRGWKTSFFHIRKRVLRHTRAIKYFMMLNSLNLDKHQMIRHRAHIRKLARDSYDPIIHVLSFGAGVQTQWLLKYMTPFLKTVKHVIIFADTGSEMPETYEYVKKYTIPWCKEHNLNFMIVREHGKDGHYEWYTDLKESNGLGLYEWYYDLGRCPTVESRTCTNEFKLKPIKRYLREHYGVSARHPANMYIGFSIDEVHRINPPKAKYFTNIFPLVDGYKDLKGGIDRTMCNDLTVKSGWPVAPASGCFCCPFKGAKTLVTDERFKEKNIALEEHHQDFPKFKMMGRGKKTLRELSTSDLDAEENIDYCKSGTCHV